MSASPSPRVHQPAMRPITTSMAGEGRTSPHEPGGVPMRVALSYRPEHPYDVSITLRTARDNIMWTVSRETLCIGVLWQTDLGLGDFRVVPMDDATTRLVFHATERDCWGAVTDSDMHVVVSRKQLLEFLRDTLAAVPPGSEGKHLNIDDTIERLFGRTPR